MISIMSLIPIVPSICKQPTVYFNHKRPISKNECLDFADGTVGEICTPIFSFFRKTVVNIAILELGPISNERSGNSTFYRGIHEFLNPSIIEKITVFF